MKLMQNLHKLIIYAFWNTFAIYFASECFSAEDPNIFWYFFLLNVIFLNKYFSRYFFWIFLIFDNIWIIIRTNLLTARLSDKFISTVMIFHIFFSSHNENEIFNVNGNWVKRQWRKINHVRETTRSDYRRFTAM